MRLTMESTDVITEIEGVPVRLWKATTESGVECVAYVHRIAVAPDADASEFERELRTQAPPQLRPLYLTLDPRML